jgi:hypothetical protein
VSINTYCFKCRKYIDSNTEEYYVFIGRTNTDNEAFCLVCYQQDIEEMKELDPFVFPIYSKNFIKMNKDD